MESLIYLSLQILDTMVQPSTLNYHLVHSQNLRIRQLSTPSADQHLFERGKLDLIQTADVNRSQCKSLFIVRSSPEPMGKLQINEEIRAYIDSFEGTAASMERLGICTH